MTEPLHPFLSGGYPVAMAHRGGAREAPENSLTAFRNAARLGFRYFELDVRATSDGEVMVFHDASLNRVTDGVGRISALPYSEVRKARVSGRDRVMRLQDLLEEFPEIRMNIDVKDDHTVEPFTGLIERLGAANRICIASFSALRLKSLRTRLGATAASSLTPPEVAALMVAARLGPLARLANVALPSSAQCVQIPISQNRIPITTSNLVQAAHERGLQVHVWTIDDAELMHFLFDMGVDGIVTDRPTVLREVLRARGSWDEVTQ